MTPDLVYRPSETISLQWQRFDLRTCAAVLYCYWYMCNSCKNRWLPVWLVWVNWNILVEVFYWVKTACTLKFGQLYLIIVHMFIFSCTKPEQRCVLQCKCTLNVVILNHSFCCSGQQVWWILIKCWIVSEHANMGWDLYTTTYLNRTTKESFL